MFTGMLFLILAAQAVATESPAVVVPHFHDLTIKTRQRRGLMHPQVNTWFFKGPRQRAEYSSENALPRFGPFVATVTQCDQHQMIHLNLHRKTYVSFNLPFPDHHRVSQDLSAEPTMEPEVLVTIDAVDTGDRRRVGAYEARRIKTSVKIEPNKGATTKPGQAKADSWYVDLPGMNCRENNPLITSSLVMGLIAPQPPGHHERIVYRYFGIEPSGLLIEETSTQKSAGNVIKNKTETLEISERPLDESLFEIPPDFTPTHSAGSRLEPALPDSDK